MNQRKEMEREEVTVCEKTREEEKRRNKQRTQMKQVLELTIQKRYVGGMTKGTFLPCKLNMLNNLSK